MAVTRLTHIRINDRNRTRCCRTPIPNNQLRYGTISNFFRGRLALETDPVRLCLIIWGACIVNAQAKEAEER